MKGFMQDDFLLDNEVGKKLYFEHAAKMPIFDFHCHLIPKQIYEDYQFSSITEAWLGKDGYGDHYKWRLLREYGIDESYITGNKSDYEKFFKFASVMPYMIGNPIYEWTHLELKTYFGITKPLSAATAKEIYDECNEKLKTLTARKMMEMNNVKTVYTTDDPLDDLHYHQLMKADKTLKINVFPAFRPDKAINIERETFVPWMKRLSEMYSTELDSLETMLSLLDKRLEYFVENGCRATDHALDVVHYKPCSYEEANAVFMKGLKGEKVTSEEEDIYKGYILVHLGKEYHKHNMVMELHIGALRDNSKRNYQIMGPDTGYDAVEDMAFAEKLSAFLNTLDESDELPKTILYTLNEKDYIVLATLKNCFQKGGIKGKIQLGTSWWFNDHYDGMMAQLSKLSSDGLLSCFVGMLTDSRSFLSYPRHDYFRRELCNFIGSLVEKGRYPYDEEVLGEIVENISYKNAEEYFKA